MASGGRVAPDGRPPVAPGVGKTARRHDLEAPATPGLHDSDLQQGDVQRLEQSQRVAPRAKRNQPSAGPGSSAPKQRTTVNGPPQEGVPDPLEFASKKIGGSGSILPDGGEVALNTSRWKPLLMAIASDPTASGPLTTMIANYISTGGNVPQNPSLDVFPQHEMEEQLFRNL